MGSWVRIYRSAKGEIDYESSPEQDNPGIIYIFNKKYPELKH